MLTTTIRMIGAVQIGVMAACVVVLVPMGLAGYHLSRNKMLFFSGALFISLAIAVHLSPYFPSLYDIFPSTPSSSSYSSSSSLVIFDSRKPCLSLLHKIHWTHHHQSRIFEWDWVKSNGNVLACDFQKVGKKDSGVLLNGSWVMVAGDSQARLFVLGLLDLVLFDNEMGDVRRDLFKRHSDYHLDVPRLGLRLDFIWAPYLTNLTHLVLDLKRNMTCPDVLVMDSGLWHMLHVTNSTDYGDGLRGLGRSVMGLLVPVNDLGLVSSRSQPQPHLFWLGMPMLVNSMLNTEEKREKMTNLTQFGYDQGVKKAKILRPDGPFVLLDIQSLSEGCGVLCTEDGMHYDGVVYEAAVHIMLNALLIQSQQKL